LPLASTTCSATEPLLFAVCLAAAAASQPKKHAIRANTGEAGRQCRRIGQQQPGFEQCLAGCRQNVAEIPQQLLSPGAELLVFIPALPEDLRQLGNLDEPLLGVAWVFEEVEPDGELRIPWLRGKQVQAK
jgi:hypothetical protein